MCHTVRRPILVAALGSPCPYCGMAMLGDREPSRDHIKPRSRRHPFRDNQAIICCRRNQAKGSLSLGRCKTLLLRRSGACPIAEAEMRDPAIKRLVGKFVGERVCISFSHKVEFSHDKPPTHTGDRPRFYAREWRLATPPQGWSHPMKLASPKRQR